MTRHFMRRLLLGVAILLGVAAAPTVVYAQDLPVEVSGTEETVWFLTAPVVQALVSVIIPLLVGLLTKFTLPNWVKGVGMIVLNAASAMLITATQGDGTAVVSNAVLLQTIFGVVISTAMYLNVYKPANLTSSTPDGKLAPNSGLGKPA